MNNNAFLDTKKRSLVLYLLIGLAIYSFYIIGLNPSGGAMHDLYTYHHPTVEIYRNNELLNALKLQNSAMGPFFYTLYSPFTINIEYLRVVNILFFLLTVLITSRLISKVNVNSSWIVLFIIVINPFVLGPALWANPDTLTLFLVMLSANILSDGTNSKCIILASLIFTLAVLTRQSIIPLGIFYVAYIFKLNKAYWQSLLFKVTLFSIPPFSAIVFLYLNWNGLVPPKFSQHSSIGITPLLQVISYFGLLTIPYTLYILKQRLTSALNVFVFFLLLILILTLTASLIYTMDFNFSQSSGVIAKIIQIKGVGLICAYLLFISGIISITNAIKRNWIFGVALIIFFLPNMVYGEVFFQKYIEPYITLLALYYGLKLQSYNIRSIFLLWLTFIYLGLFFVALYIY